jgi:hypothetical protein
MADTVEGVNTAKQAEKPAPEKAKVEIPALTRDHAQLISLGFEGCKRILVVRCDCAYIAAACGLLAKNAALGVVCPAANKAEVEEATKGAPNPVAILRGIPRHGGEEGYDGILLAGASAGADSRCMEELLMQNLPAVVVLFGTGENGDGVIRTALRAAVRSYDGPRATTSGVMLYPSRKK